MSAIKIKIGELFHVEEAIYIIGKAITPDNPWANSHGHIIAEVIIINI